MMSPANNVTRMLDARGVHYQVFELPNRKLGAVEAAGFLQTAPENVFKTIVVLAEPPGKHLLVLVPGDCIVDLKKVATVMGEKKVRLSTEREAEALTGLQAGGISPLALLNHGFRVLIDVAARKHEDIHVSAGARGLNLRLAVEDLARLTGGRFADVSSPT